MRSTIRLAREEDAEAIAAIYRPYVESTVISFEVEPPLEGEMARRRLVAADADAASGGARRAPDAGRRPGPG